MRINDSVFGKLEYDFIWSKDITISFLGNEVKIALMVKGDESGRFDEEQYVAIYIAYAKLGTLATKFFATDFGVL